jgi:hypothetical protein
VDYKLPNAHPLARLWIWPALQVSVRKAALTAARKLLEAAPLDVGVAQLWLGIAAPMVR